MTIWDKKELFPDTNTREKVFDEARKALDNAQEKNYPILLMISREEGIEVMGSADMDTLTNMGGVLATLLDETIEKIFTDR